MSYLIDTNVLSELRRKQADGNVVRWLDQRPPTTLFLSVLTLGELRKGIELMPEGERKRSYLDWLEVELPRFFSGRVLAIDEAVADRWGRLAAQAGRALPAIDSLLAATALTRGLTLVTRNERDFQHPGLNVINPWNV
ncbi:Toxin FitB [compost metagenome]|uniref:type II toxin-antitoxin system VapC family toxin n=1 Tax=Achromobacter sp. Root83 TaxID=1736602 RepID=UPI00070E6AE9|nr:type II toxin-antitoxin system VapC family toxin [Achromobacter sp. Root83]KRC86258.1 recombinase [Achromobacter sp. Root83]